MKYPSLLSSAELGKLKSLEVLGGMAHFGGVLPTRMLQLPEFIHKGNSYGGESFDCNGLWKSASATMKKLSASAEKRVTCFSETLSNSSE